MRLVRDLACCEISYNCITIHSNLVYKDTTGMTNLMTLGETVLLCGAVTVVRLVTTAEDGGCAVVAVVTSDVRRGLPR